MIEPSAIVMLDEERAVPNSDLEDDPGAVVLTCANCGAAMTSGSAS